MADTTTTLNNLNLVKGTVTQAESKDLSANNLYLLDPQYTGGKLLTADANGLIKEATTVVMKATFSDGTTADYKIMG